MPPESDPVVRRKTVDAQGWWALVNESEAGPATGFKRIKDEKENSLRSSNKFVFSGDEIASFRLPFQTQNVPSARRQPLPVPDPSMPILRDEVRALEDENSILRLKMVQQHRELVTLRKQHTGTLTINSALATHMKKWYSEHARNLNQF